MSSLDIRKLAALADEEPTVATLIREVGTTIESADVPPSGSTIGILLELAVEELIPFPNQPFRLYTGEKLDALADSIQLNGVLSPIITRCLEDSTYQIISGHNRVAACIKLGKKTIPAIVKKLDDDQAWIELIESNLNQRQDLLPSEKAWAYRIRMEKLNKKVGRPSNVQKLCHDGTNIVDDEIFQMNGDSARTVYRYIRLTYLTASLLEMVDKKRLILVCGEELSYLSNEEQEIVASWLDETNLKIHLGIAKKIRKLVGNHVLSAELLKTSFPQDTMSKTNSISLQLAPIRKIVGNAISEKQLQSIILELLKKYYKEDDTNADKKPA